MLTIIIKHTGFNDTPGSGIAGCHGKDIFLGNVTDLRVSYELVDTGADKLQAIKSEGGISILVEVGEQDALESLSFFGIVRKQMHVVYMNNVQCVWLF
jgi:hypothetical protein